MERPEDVAVEQHRRADQVAVVAGGEDEVGLLRGERAPDRPLVVGARPVVADHGERDRACEVARRRAERPRRPADAADRRRPEVADARLEAAEAAVVADDRRPVGGRRDELDAAASRQRPAQRGRGLAEPGHERAAAERVGARREQVEPPVDEHRHDDQDEHARRASRAPRRPGAAGVRAACVRSSRERIEAVSTLSRWHGRPTARSPC